MAYTNSPLVSYTKLSPNHSGQRNHPIDTITIHCVVGQCTVERIGEIFAPVSRQASSNYGVGLDGRIGMYVEEKNRSWCTSSASNDHRAITIEVASDTTHPYAVNDKAYAALLDLVTDICKRNNIKQLLWKGDKSLIGQVDKQNMTVHRWFANKSCPGEYLYSRHGAIADEVNKRLNAGSEKPSKPSTGVLYRVQTGAFGNRSNADTLLAKVKAAGFETYMVQSNGLYKVQVGAYGVKSNADAMAAKLKAKGFDVYITTEGGSAVSSSPSPAPVKSIQVGSKVKVRSGAKSYTGGGLSSSVYKNTYDVIQMNGDRVVIGIGKAVTAAINKNDLILQ
jgi:hypothetical protein